MIYVAGARLEGPVRKLLAQQREKLHSKGEGHQVLRRKILPFWLKRTFDRLNWCFFVAGWLGDQQCL